MRAVLGPAHGLLRGAEVITILATDAMLDTPLGGAKIGPELRACTFGSLIRGGYILVFLCPDAGPEVFPRDIH